MVQITHEAPNYIARASVGFKLAEASELGMIPEGTLFKTLIALFHPIRQQQERKPGQQNSVTKLALV